MRNFSPSLPGHRVYEPITDNYKSDVISSNNDDQPSASQLPAGRQPTARQPAARRPTARRLAVRRLYLSRRPTARQPAVRQLCLFTTVSLLTSYNVVSLQGECDTN
jgi:hypothetical protein